MTFVFNKNFTEEQKKEYNKLEKIKWYYYHRYLQIYKNLSNVDRVYLWDKHLKLEQKQIDYFNKFLGYTLNN